MRSRFVSALLLCATLPFASEAQTLHVAPVASASGACDASSPCTLRAAQARIRALDKGYLWVSRQLLGRYWKIGLQQRLCRPASWLRPGDNELPALDLHRTTATPIRGAERLHG